MAEPIHSLDRGVGGLTLKLDDAFSRTRKQYDEIGLQEVWQQYQIEVIATEAKWGHVDIYFDSPFVYAPTRRHNSVVFPHATFGIYAPVEDPSRADTAPDPDSDTTGVALTPDDALPPLIDVFVTHYFRNSDTDQFYGARLFVAVRKVGDANFAGAAAIHATFQGFANWDEDETDL
jgi:hypothetical protein